MLKNNKGFFKITTLLMAIVMIAMVVLPAVPTDAEAINPYSEKAEELIQNIYDKYMEDGKVSAASNTELDGFAIYVLNKAKVDVLNWEYKGITVEQKLNELIRDAIEKESTDNQLDAKRLAYLYIAAESSGKTTEAADLLENLKTRQKNTEEGGFVDGLYSEYINLPTFDILTISGKLDVLENLDNAFAYIRDLNPTKSDFPDFMTISQTARVLKGFEVKLNKTGVSEEIQTILTWLKKNQAIDGSFNAGEGDVITNTSEVLWTIKSVGITDPFTEKDKDNALNFLMENDSFANIGANVWALRALLINGAKPDINPDRGSDGDDELPNTVTSPTVKKIKIDLAVIDDDGKVIYGPKSLRLYSEDKFGLTALGALHETGLDYDAGRDDDFVTEIEGVKNKGLSGWMYAVNGRVPSVAAIDKEIKDGDEVLWYYSKSSSAKVPRFPDEEDKNKEKAVEEVEDKDKKPTEPTDITPPIRTFSDVGEDFSWAKNAIEILAGRGIISGTEKGQFEPNRPINRAEFTKLVIETLGNESLSQGTEMYSDVDSTKWYADYIAKAHTTGLIEGSDGKFRPKENITRNEVAVILHRMQNKAVPKNEEISFQDSINIPEWARLGVAYSLEKGLLQGYPDNTFKGDQPMTRAEVAVVLYRYIKTYNL